MEDKIDKMLETQTTMQVDLSKLQVGYDHHVKRTDKLEELVVTTTEANETKIGALDERVTTLEEPGKALRWLKEKWKWWAGIAGFLLTVLGILTYIGVLSKPS
jgi:hypothetical protein